MYVYSHSLRGPTQFQILLMVCLDFKSQITKTFIDSVNSCKFSSTFINFSYFIIKIYFTLQSKYYEMQNKYKFKSQIANHQNQGLILNLVD